MASVKVLAIGIADEFPTVIVAAAHQIELPDEYVKSLTHAAGFPSLVDYAYWNEIIEQVPWNAPYAQVRLSFLLKIAQNYLYNNLLMKGLYMILT